MDSEQAIIGEPSAADIRLVISASALGTVFEWYDFFIYGTLAASGIIGRTFFPAGNEVVQTLLAWAGFAVGFGFRPLGAVLFGYLGDRLGRKYTFLVTITLMGIATAGVGIVPSAASIGYAAPALVLLLRVAQGLALGGEYGGAAVYVAEHSPPGKSGFYTSFIQAGVVGGFILSLAVVLTTRGTLASAVWNDWGWRIPFLFSILLLAISLWMRLKLSESPVFLAMRAEGERSRNPLKDSLTYPGNVKRMLVALFGIAAGLTVIWYTAMFTVLSFLQTTMRVEETTAQLITGAGALFGLFWFVLFGRLSDRVGRKPPIVIGYAATLVLLFPVFWVIGAAANPALSQAARRAAGRRRRAALQLQPLRRDPGGPMRQVARLFLEEGDRLHQDGRAGDLRVDRRRGGGGPVAGGDRRGADRSGLRPRQGAPGRRQHRADPRRDPGDGSTVGDHLRSGSRAARRDVSARDPLFVAVDPVPSRHRLFRRLSSVHQSVHRREDGQSVRGAVVHDGGSGDGADGDRAVARGTEKRPSMTPSATRLFGTRGVLAILALFAATETAVTAQSTGQADQSRASRIVAVGDRAFGVQLRVSGDLAVLMVTQADGRNVPYLSIATVDDALAVLADTRLAFAWPALLAWAGPDLTGLRDRALARAKQAADLGVVAITPRSQPEQYSGSGEVTSTLQYARTLIASGRLGEGLSLLRQRVAASRAADAAGDRDGYGTQLLSVRLASEMFEHGNEKGGLAMLDALAADGSIAPEYRLNIDVNRALFYAQAGRSEQALTLITAALKAFRGEQLPVDGEAIQVPDSEANFAWIEACALDGLGRHDEARMRMAQIEGRPDQGPARSTTQKARIWGFLCMHDGRGLAREFSAQLAIAAPGADIFAIMQPLNAPRPIDQDTIRRALADPQLAGSITQGVRQLPSILQPAVAGWRPIPLDAAEARR